MGKFRFENLTDETGEDLEDPIERPIKRKGENRKNKFKSPIIQEETEKMKKISEKSERFIVKEKEKVPASKYKEKIQEMIKKNSSVIIVGETGSGKTTRIPLYLAEILEGKIGVTEPRVFTTVDVAGYNAEMIGCRLGEEIGYQVRFDKQTEKGTKINFMTDGIMLRMLQEDPLLKEFSAVMVDEAHERNLNMDIIKGILKIIRKLKLREKSDLEPLKEITTSATLEKDKFIEFDGKGKENADKRDNYIEIPGRVFPIETTFMPKDEYNKYVKKGDKNGDYFDYTEAAADKALQSIIEKSEIKDKADVNDILVFMPGQNEIYLTIEKIEKKLKENNIENVVIYPLYGNLKKEEQDKAKYGKVGKNVIKIIVSTDIAETGVTLSCPVDVIESGLIKQKEYNHKTGVESLNIVPKPQKRCEQAKGRAGRLRKGECSYLFIKDDFESRREFQEPEINRLNLSHIVLIIKKVLKEIALSMEKIEMDENDIEKIKDIRNFEFIDSPELEPLEQAIENLKTLGALDENENITEIGEKMAKIGHSPEISRAIIESDEKDYKCEESLATIAAFLGEHSVFFTPENPNEKAKATEVHSKFKISKESDFLSLLKVWEEYEKVYRKAQQDFEEFRGVFRGSRNYFVKDQIKGWAYRNFLNVKVLEEARKIRFQIFKSLKDSKISVGTNKDPEVIGKCITAGLIGNLMEYDYRHSYQRVKDSEAGFYIHPSSATFGPDSKFIVPAKIVKTKKTYMRMCQAVKPEWIKGVAPQMVEEKFERNPYYDSESDKVLQKVNFSLKNTGTSLSKEKREVSGEESVKAFAKALTFGKIDLPFIEHNKKVMEKLNNLWKRSGGKI
jgi:HrpA-like RNA helicase